jgi:hypothetical protein
MNGEGFAYFHWWNVAQRDTYHPYSGGAWLPLCQRCLDTWRWKQLQAHAVTACVP